MIASGAPEIHQRGARRADDHPGSYDQGPAKPQRRQRLSVSIFESSSAFSFAVTGVVLLLLLIGGILMLSDSSSSQVRIDERIPVMAGRNAKKLVDEAIKKKATDDNSEEYAQRVRERYLNRIAKLREQELKRLAEEEAANGNKEEEEEEEAAVASPIEAQIPAEPVPPMAAPPQPAPEEIQQVPLQQAPEAIQQAPLQQAPPQEPSAASQTTLEESLKAIHEQLERLQVGFHQKRVEQEIQTPIPIAPPLTFQELQRQAELQDLMNKMNELRTQSAALEAMIEQAKNGHP